MTFPQRPDGEPSLLAGTFWTCLAVAAWAMVLGVAL